MNIKDSNVTIMVKDMDKSVGFYEAIGFKIKNRWGNDYAQLAAPGVTLGLHPAEKTVVQGSGSTSIGFTTDNLEEAKSLLKTVGLESQMNKYTNKVSGGQAQRVAICRSLINKPTIVLADEPTGNLDSLSAQTTVQLMKSLNRKLGHTFIIVTHDRPQFGDVDKIITIKDGRIIDDEMMEVPPVN